ncbi:hypothetical protein [Thalassovita sp.]|uniref:hypothetical protein n=1 Tax=Thalassovita sp. TaxID=1979401 RepID=UPI0029DE8177|nr:hypothetical protein [Thalassovita sp.]
MQDLRVEVLCTGDRVVVGSDAFEVFFETSEDVTDSANFAVWTALPFAMRLGRPLHIVGRVSPVLLRNARHIARLWTMWAPDLYRDIDISTSEQGETPCTGQDRELMTFSGGVDSTVALAEHVRQTGRKPDVLTVLGMDYRRGDTERFQKLLDRTAEFRRQRTGAHLIVKSDAASVMRRFGIPADRGFGFQLAASFFLFEHRYGHFLTAADFADFQECLVGPYSTSSCLTHHYSSGGSQSRLLGLETTRAEKVAMLLNDDLALRSVSFCKDYNTRPDNCGACSKCVRTKAMFFAHSQKVPDIFLTPGFTPNDLGSVDMSRTFERIFAQDVLSMARQHGNETYFTRLAEGLHDPDPPTGLKLTLHKLRIMLKARNARKTRK